MNVLHPVMMLRMPIGVARCGVPEYLHSDEEFADIPKFLVRHPERTYVLRAEGQSMYPTIPDGAMVVVETDVDYLHGSLVVVALRAGIMVKRYDRTRKLLSDNPLYPALELGIYDDAVIIGVVKHIIITP